MTKSDNNKHVSYKKNIRSFIKGILILLFFAFLVIELFKTNNKKELCIYRWYEKDESVFFDTYFFFGKLRAEFESYGYKVIDNIRDTKERCLNSEILLVVFNEAPDISSRRNKKNYLFAMESPLLLKNSNTLAQEHFYTNIFTYNQKLTSDSRYIYTPLPFDNRSTKKPSFDFNQRPYFLVQVASNYYNGGIYHKRRETVQWLLENAPDDVLLYGRDWKYITSKLSSRGKEALKRQNKGRISTKEDVFRKAKFVLTYENEIGDGYVSEKIQDAFLYGSVPIYLGTDDVFNFIPKECFINRKDFKSDADLYSFLKQMTPMQYKTYTGCIQEYLSKPSAFEPKKVVQIISKTIFPHPKIFYQLKNKIPYHSLIYP